MQTQQTVTISNTSQKTQEKNSNNSGPTLLCLLLFNIFLIHFLFMVGQDVHNSQETLRNSLIQHSLFTNFSCLRITKYSTHTLLWGPPNVTV